MNCAARLGQDSLWARSQKLGVNSQAKQTRRMFYVRDASYP